MAEQQHMLFRVEGDCGEGWKTSNCLGPLLLGNDLRKWRSSGHYISMEKSAYASWTGGDLGYKFGLRPVEKILSLAVSMSLLGWFVFETGNHVLARGPSLGLMYGILASFSIVMIGVSVSSEGKLKLIACLAAGISLGWGALGMFIVGYLLFTLLVAVMVVLVDALFYRN